MSHNPVQFLRDMLPTQELRIRVSTGDMRRLRAYMERYNERPGPRDPYDPDSPEDYDVLIHTLIHAGLDEDEEEHGLRATLDGQLLKRA
jgi:hypothetical protein